MKIISHCKTVIIAFLVVCTALSFRVWNLAEISPGFSGHQLAQFTLVKTVLEQPMTTDKLKNLLFADETGPNALIETFWYKIFGVSVLSMRLLPALVGSLSIGIAYLIGNTVIGSRFGLFFAILLNSSIWHLSFSRYENLEHIAPIFVVMITLFSSVRMLKKPTDYWNYLLLGTSTGISIYFYAATQMMMLFTPIVVLLSLTKFKTIKLYKLKLLAIYLLSFIILATPQLFYYINVDHFPPLRKRNINQDYYQVTSLGGLPSQIHESINELFVNHTDTWIGGLGGVFSIPETTLFVIGVFSSLHFYKKKIINIQISILIVWLCILGFLPGIFGPSPVPFRRLMLIGIPIAFISALGVLAMYRCIISLLSKYLPEKIILLAPISLLLLLSLRYFSPPYTLESMQHVSFRKIIQDWKNNPSQTTILLHSQTDIDLFSKLLEIELYDNYSIQKDSFTFLIYDELLQTNNFIQSWCNKLVTKTYTTVEIWNTYLESLPDCKIRFDDSPPTQYQNYFVRITT